MTRSNQPHGKQYQRSFGAYFARAGWTHLVLLTGTLIFAFPFLWMIATSLRTDEELVDPGWMPEVPSFRANSPYVRHAPTIVEPLGVPSQAWKEALPQFMEIAKARALAVARDGPGIDREKHAESAAAVMVNDLSPQIEGTIWDQGAQAARQRFAGLISPQVVNDALDDRLSRFELLGLQVRTYDEHIVKVADGAALAKAFKVEGGNATLEPVGSTTWVKYSFASADEGPVVLRCDFDLPCDPKDLHKLLVSQRLDNSWHYEWATLDVPGHHWVSTRYNYMGQNRAGSWIYQPQGPDDDSYKKRNWVTLVDGEGGTPAAANVEKTAVASATDSAAAAAAAFTRPATLRLYIYPSSTPRAIWGKVQWNYRRAFDWVPFWTYVGNSTILVVLSAIGTLFSSTFVAYAFARLNWPGRSVAFLLLLSTMMLPAQVTMIPSFMIWRELGWYNTLNPLWVPSFCGVAFFIFMMTQHMKTIPKDLEEAARIDGLNAIQTWWYIIVPLVKPCAAAVAIMTVMGAWNEFMGPLVYLRDQGKFPLSLGIFGIRADAGIGAVDWTMIMAGNVMMTVPMIILFLMFQRYFVKGMALSGMKG